MIVIDYGRFKKWLLSIQLVSRYFSLSSLSRYAVSWQSKLKYSYLFPTFDQKKFDDNWAKHGYIFSVNFALKYILQIWRYVCMSWSETYYSRVTMTEVNYVTGNTPNCSCNNYKFTEIQAQIHCKSKRKSPIPTTDNGMVFFYFCVIIWITIKYFI